MANDLVVTLGARLDKFAADMDQAGSIADGAVSKIEKSFAGLNPGINLGAILAGGGAIAALSGLFATLSSINSEMVELAKNAEYAGLKVQRFQELKFAATQGGVGSAQASADLRNVAKLLADAKENENSLTKLLDANNIKYRDRNGDIIKMNQFLVIAGDLIKRFGSLPEKVEAAKALGVTEQWVNALRNGGDAFMKVAEGAQAAGAVIDSQTIAKAAEFDREWKKASDLMGLQFKAMITDVSGYLGDLISKAGEFITELAKARGATDTPGESGEKTFNRIADAAAVLAKETQGAAQDVDQLTRVINNMLASGGGDPEIIATLVRIREEAKETAKFVNEALTMETKKQFPGGVVPLPGSRPAGADKPSASDARLSSNRAKASGDTASAYEREIDITERKIRVMEAEIAASGTSVGNKAALVETERLYHAAEKDGIKITDEYIKEIEELAAKYGTVTQQANDAKMKIDAINTGFQVVGSAMSTAFADAVVEGKKLDDVLKSLVNTLLKATINTTFGNLFKTGGNAFTSAFGGAAAAGTNYAHGGMTLVGEKGPELVNLPRGSQVIPNDALRNMGGSGSITYAPAIDARGASVEAVARLARVIEQDRAMFASRTVATIQQARRGRVPGL